MTPKQTAFAREYMVDRNATQAAIRAGYSAATAEQQGYQQLQNPSVREAIEALEAEHRERCNVTVEALTRELFAARDLAHSIGQPSAAVSAIMGIAKLHGLIVDKRVTENINRSAQEMTDDELTAIVRAKDGAAVH